jgi:ABC-type Fe3+ transport system permease subunit
MTLALSVIGLTIALLVLAARLGDAQRQLAQARRESMEQAPRAQEEQAACQYGTVAALACLLAGLAAASWQVPHAQARAARFRAGADARAGAADRRAGR